MIINDIKQTKAANHYVGECEMWVIFSSIILIID